MSGVGDSSEEDVRLTRNYAPSREMPAIYVNNFYVTGSSHIMRIAFGESSDEPVGTKYRVSIAMPLEDAKELSRVVQEMVKRVEQDHAAAKAEK
jgi:hypothetical protein